MTLREVSQLGNVKFDANGAVRLDENFGNAFDDLLDDLHSKHVDLGPTQAELDEQARAEREMCTAISRQLAEELTPRGFKRYLCRPDGTGGGYLVTVHDRDGRRFEVEYTIDQMLETPGTGREAMLRVVQDVAKGILNTREKYFARMRGGG